MKLTLDVKGLEASVRRATRAAALVFAREVEREVPVATGRLRGSVRVYRLARPAPGQIGHTVGVTNAAYYWRFLEAGFHPHNHGVVREPFFQPSFDRAKAAAYAEFERVLSEQLR